jgi:hypothetical protein
VNTPFLSARRAYAIEPHTNLCDSCSKPGMHLYARENAWLCVGCRVERPSSAHEDIARAKKAYRIALAISAITPADFNDMSEGEWALLARSIGAKGVSLETRVLVAEVLERAAQREQGALYERAS